jgi:sugar phosphate isomerase/epimerase
MSTKDLSKLCLHTMTNKPWSLDECLSNYEKAGIGGVSVWRNVIEGKDLQQVNRDIKNSGLTPVSLVRGGFFTGNTKAERAAAITENKTIIDEAQAIGAPLVVLVCGATPGQTVEQNIQQIRDGIEALLPHAQQAGVKLGIEPLHPMYADTRSSISSMRSANELAEGINSPYCGVTVDVFHLYWEEHLRSELLRCGKNGNLFSYHICDWKTNPEDMLNDRGLMGEGIIPVDRISEWVAEAGFDGFHEVEIFSNRYWEMDQKDYLKKIIKSYNQLSEPRD